MQPLSQRSTLQENRPGLVAELFIRRGNFTQAILDTPFGAVALVLLEFNERVLQLIRFLASKIH
jgi:hypothetical protein